VTVPNKAGKQIAYTLFDPGYNVLKTVSFAKSYKELITQAKSAVNMIDRYDALVALRDSDIDKKRDDLMAIFYSEKYFSIRSEVVYQLKGDEQNKKSQTLLRNALKDQNFQVRRAVVEFVDTLPKAMLADAEALLNDSSYVTIETTLRKLVAQYPKNKNRYFETVKGTMGIFKNVRIAMLELKCKDDVKSNVSELIDYTSHSYEFMTRVKAMNAIEKLYSGDEGDKVQLWQTDVLIRNLFDAMLNSNSRLANPARKTMKKLMERADIKQVAQAYFKTGTWKVWQKDALKSLFE
jgi:hypothetical protein